MKSLVVARVLHVLSIVLLVIKFFVLEKDDRRR